MSILITASATDPETARVFTELRNHNVTVIHLDTSAFPESLRLSLGQAPLDTPSAVYVRRLAWHPLSPGNEADLAERPRGFIAQCEEKRAMLESLLLTLQQRGAVLVNSLDANYQHRRKPQQLALLEARGLPVPRWLASNNPDHVREFVRTVGQAVYKPLAGGATVRLVERRDLSRARLAALAVAPVLFQEYIKGIAVRAYVVGRRVVAAAEIHSPEIDYRRDEAAVVPTCLTHDERAACLAAARACGMAFTGVDLIRHADGFHILECNPSPMFATFEEKTGLDVAGPLSEFLKNR